MRWEPPTVTVLHDPGTPIHDQLRRETRQRELVQALAEGLSLSMAQATASLKRAMESTGRQLATFMARVQLRQLEQTPEAVLDRIRSDAASLDWHDAWQAERAQDDAHSWVDAMTEAWPSPREAYWRAAEERRNLGVAEWWVAP